MKRISNQSFIYSNEIEWQPTDEGVARKILAFDNELMMVCVRFEKGAAGTLHHHVHRQISYVESGRFEVTINNEKKILEKGDCFFVAPQLSHGMFALGAGILIDVFTPARKDFLS